MERKGNQANKILVLVLPVLEFCCFQKAQKYFKTGNFIGSKGDLVNFRRALYQAFTLGSTESY